jgi:hypothetical protein
MSPSLSKSEQLSVYISKFEKHTIYSVWDGFPPLFAHSGSLSKLTSAAMRSSLAQEAYFCEGMYMQLAQPVCAAGRIHSNKLSDMYLFLSLCSELQFAEAIERRGPRKRTT